MPFSLLPTFRTELVTDLTPEFLASQTADDGF